MNILFVFYGADYAGGTSFSTFTLAAGLAGRGHVVHAYVTRTSSGLLKSDLVDRGVVVHDGTAPALTRPLYERRPLHRIAQSVMGEYLRLIPYPRSEREVERIVAAHDIDLVVISGGACVTGTEAVRHTGTPLVWHVREFLQEDHGHDYFSWVHAYERMCDADCLVCVSRAVEEKMRRLCPGVRTQVVYNGLDTALFHPEGRITAAPGMPVRVMMSGGIRYSKGTFLVLEALARIAHSCDVILDIYGGEGGGVGEHESDLVSRCQKLGLFGRVSYHGVVSDIAKAYRCHDILVMASRAEAFGRVTAEAMMCGCAVVGSDSGGTPELIANDRGYLFEPNDVDSLARALAHAIEDPVERNRRVSAALSFSQENFSAQEYVEKTEEIYLSVVARASIDGKLHPHMSQSPQGRQ